MINLSIYYIGIFFLALNLFFVYYILRILKYFHTFQLCSKFKPRHQGPVPQNYDQYTFRSRNQHQNLKNRRRGPSKQTVLYLRLASYKKLSDFSRNGPLTQSRSTQEFLRLLPHQRGAGVKVLERLYRWVEIIDCFYPTWILLVKTSRRMI